MLGSTTGAVSVLAGASFLWHRMTDGVESVDGRVLDRGREQGDRQVSRRLGVYE